MVGHGGSSSGSYLADPTSTMPSHCASIVATSTLRVNLPIYLVLFSCSFQSFDVLVHLSIQTLLGWLPPQQSGHDEKHGKTVHDDDTHHEHQCTFIIIVRFWRSISGEVVKAKQQNSCPTILYSSSLYVRVATMETWISRDAFSRWVILCCMCLMGPHAIFVQK